MNRTTLAGAIALCVMVCKPAVGAGDPSAGKEKSFNCEACHSAANLAMNPTWPRLDGQNVDYLVRQMQDFQAGKRLNGVMQQMLASLSEADIMDVSAYYASLPLPPPGEADPKLAAQGKKLYTQGTSAVASCASCHGANGHSEAAGGFSILAGQQSRYVFNQLLAYKYGDRSNDSGSVMRDIAAKLDDAEMEAVAAYVASLK
ncbi:MAG: c-type cytochrome [Thiohalobacteraceae bacterium]|nr:cytochrome c4 [Gammaproteobacteria bacterium]